MRDKFLLGGSYSRSDRQLGSVTAETEQNGEWVGRLGDKGIALSAKLIVSYSAVLSAGETLTLAGNFQDALDAAGTGAADFGEAVPATVVATGDSGGSTEEGTAEIDVDLSGAREFVRSQVTVATSGAGTLAYSAVIVFYGDHRQPNTKAIAAVGTADSI
ncbi:hypothetical protein [Shinella zoogloeoides]|uniref:hypothetical protein n=1 Tax=Shinella zoogloeoides TaxID=352475 RepID=UPI00299F1FF6|nr:hypothetical protein [Shinella zoogloeoides]WPE19955.1 hypothetical protein ShzoTeo12_11350 [Shinella zoogloeoides]